MKLKSRSILITTMLAVSAGWIAPASVHSADAPENRETTADTCSTMLVPEGVTCMFSTKTRQSIAVAQVCQVMAAAISYPSGMNPLRTGLGLVGTSATCKIDPQTDLVIGVPPSVQVKALPPIKSRQQKARSLLAAAATAAKGQDACTGMTVPDGMICLVRPSTERPTAYWNDCGNWIVPAGVACVVDPETGTAMTVARPD